MRLPLIAPLDSRDGTSSKDGLTKNMLVEKDTAAFASLRPGLSRTSSNSGVGRGVVEFNGVLLSVFGTTLSSGEPLVTVGTVSGDYFDFVQSTQ